MATRDYYERNRERCIAKTREWKEANPEKFRQLRRAYYRRLKASGGLERVRARDLAWRTANRERQMLTAARSRAKKLGVPFDLALDDISIPAICPVLGMPLVQGKGQPTHASPALDRLVPSKGYVRGNVRVISHRANSLKSNATIEELERVIEYMRNNIDDKEG